MVMFEDRIVTGPVVSTQKSPAAVAALVRGAGMKKIAVEEQSIT